MIEPKLERIDSPDDPNRCQGDAAGPVGSQCPYKAMPGSLYCVRHAGDSARTQQINALRLYRLGKYQNRVNDFVDHDQVKSLREEIGIVRMVLEQIVTSCQSETELILYSGRITEMADKLNKLVASCHRLELSSGEVMDKTKALNFAQRIVEIIGRYVDDPTVIDSVSEEILQCLAAV